MLFNVDEHLSNAAKEQIENIFDPMEINLLIDTLNKAEGGNGYDGYEEYDAELAEIYSSIFGVEKLNAARASDGWPKDYHTCWKCLLTNKIIEKKVNYLDFIDLTSKVNSVPIRFYIMIDLLKYTLDNFDDIHFAEKMISALPNLNIHNSDGKYIGYRTLLRHFAEKNDLQNFKKVLPLADGRKSPKHNVEWSKGILISQRVANNGFEEGLKLVNTKMFGKGYVLYLLRPLLPTIDLDRIDAIIASYPDFLKESPHLKSILYTEFAVITLKKSFDVKIFDKVFDYLSSRDKFSADWHLFDLASTTKDLELINKCKRLIHTPSVRKEINSYIELVKKSHLEV